VPPGRVQRRGGCEHELEQAPAGVGLAETRPRGAASCQHYAGRAALSSLAISGRAHPGGRAGARCIGLSRGVAGWIALQWAQPSVAVWLYVRADVAACWRGGCKSVNVLCEAVSVPQCMWRSPGASGAPHGALAAHEVWCASLSACRASAVCAGLARVGLARVVH